MHISHLFSILILCLITVCCKSKSATAQNEKAPQGIKYDQILTQFDSKLDLTPDEWKRRLSEGEYYVLRRKGTERAFSGDLWDNKKEGSYVCGGCGLVLFESNTKFKSGTGWPSFYQSINKAHVGELVDNSHGMKRTEVVCNRCEGHLGHIFNDGPAPTGLRYCINSVSLDFVSDETSVKSK